MQVKAVMFMYNNVGGGGEEDYTMSQPPTHRVCMAVFSLRGISLVLLDAQFVQLLVCLRDSPYLSMNFRSNRSCTLQLLHYESISTTLREHLYYTTRASLLHYESIV